MEIANRPSSNENEAAQALRQAQKLMALYDVSEDVIKAADVNESGAVSLVKKEPPKWERHLAIIVSMAFGTQVIYVSGNTYQNGVWRFIGVGAGAEVSSYTFDVLLRQLKKARQQHLEVSCPNVKNRETKVLRGNLFCIGWLNTVSQQVTDFAENIQHNEAIRAYMRNQYPTLETFSPPKSNQRKPNFNDLQSYEKGAAAGRDVVLNSGVGSEQQEPCLKLADDDKSMGDV